MVIKEFPKRKPNRLKNFDYSTNGAYFITICTKNKECIFGSVGADSISARMIEDIFIKAINGYSNVYSPKYVIMPNHFHAIIVIDRADMESAPTVSEIVQSFKRQTTIEYIKLVKKGVIPPFDKAIWQRSFYDHIIRNENDYNEIWQYIEQNPKRWKEDKLFVVNEKSIIL